MKFAITGHTQGLGAAIVNQLSYGHSIVGFSKSTGYDISNAADRKLIIEHSLDCHVFVNNAHAGYAQTELLYELWDTWKKQDKLIVNIGSNTTDSIKPFPHKYVAEKIALEKASEQLANLNMPCKVSLYKFGWIGTERVLKNYNPDNYILVNDAAEIIIQTLLITHNYKLTNITILP